MWLTLMSVAMVLMAGAMLCMSGRKGLFPSTCTVWMCAFLGQQAGLSDWVALPMYCMAIIGSVVTTVLIVMDKKKED